MLLSCVRCVRVTGWAGSPPASDSRNSSRVALGTGPRGMNVRELAASAQDALLGATPKAWPLTSGGRADTVELALGAAKSSKLPLL
jgi:hypothetical protein